MKTAIPCLFLALATASCSSTNLMSLSVKQPAPVSVPANIRTVAVVNRSDNHDGNGLLDAVHKALSLETTSLQRSGSEASLQGLSDELSRNNRFDAVKPLKNLRLTSFGAGVFPNAMPWDSVEKICHDAGTDAVFSLELFDAESEVNYAATAANLTTGNTTLTVPDHHLNMTTIVKSGWRLYDPSTKTILDEYVYSRTLSFNGSGINPLEAASVLIGRKEAVKDAGNKSGMAYGERILPYWIRVSRDYFVKGDDNFAMARRKAIAGNWDGAAALWRQETGNSNGTLAGRACYNMAIIEEINGNLDAAIGWAQRSYETYRIRLALDYLNILRDRKGQDNLLKQQTVAANP